MSFQSYLLSLMKEFQQEPKKTAVLPTFNHKWFGLIPFLVRWLLIQIRRNVPSQK